MSTRRLPTVVGVCVIALALAKACSIQLSGNEEGLCCSEQPDLHLSFSGDTPEEKLLSLSEFM